MLLELFIKWLPKLIQGATLTLELTALSVIAGLIVAIPLGIARSSSLWYVRSLPYAYIFFFRGTPLLIQLFLVYYGLSQFDVVRESVLWPYLRSPFWCAVITMTLHTAAYIAEILRGAIQAIPPGEIEAARALGMSRFKTLVHIVLPRAARIGLPAYSNEVILMLKASSLASTVTLLELTGMTRTIISRTYQTVDMFLIAGVIYLVMSFVLIQGFKLLERWLRVDACQGR
ncbi:MULTISPECIES: ABC transporter permease [Pseudomonas]|jgi:polar amino acid transport system permease protein|uniref:ABC transporter permease n=1 Tax=Pseudomonas TaxID=286 RepID=UPI0002899301|nr:MULTISPECIES: ABC transporter permease [Pseudomonas]AMB81518.1 ABC transporter permease [Pseudomonas fragi]NBF17975.1 ABC transporter permease subunit [Pseudomonas sp. Fl4BN2]NNG61223.1 ABC transporter permease [Pseudomonas sp. GC01]AUB77288.1 ABC transporter permease [Pseudomonas sp. Lz4W]MCH4867361.1 ABC transporter permease [Pseudomonas sp. TMW22089]